MATKERGSARKPHAVPDPDDAEDEAGDDPAPDGEVEVDEAPSQASIPGTAPRQTKAVKDGVSTISFSCSPPALAKAIAAVRGACTKRSTMPVLAHVLIKVDGPDLVVIATDLEITMTAELRDTVKVRREGMATVDAKVLLGILKSLPASGEVQVTAMDNGKLELACGKTVFRVAATDGSTFPMAQVEEWQGADIDAGAMRELIDRTAYAISTDAARYNLCGLHLETIEPEDGRDGGIRAVSTDGHRIAIAESRWANAPKLARSVIVPTKVIKELREILTEAESDAVVEMAFLDNRMEAERGPLSLSGQLIEGQFPDWRQVMPGPPKFTTTVRKSDLQEALARLALVARDKGHGIVIAFKPKKIILDSSSIDVGEVHEEIDAESTGNMRVGMNIHYLQEALASMPDDFVVLGVTDELGPLVMTGAEDNGRELRAVLMPMRM